MCVWIGPDIQMYVDLAVHDSCGTYGSFGLKDINGLEARVCLVVK